MFLKEEMDNHSLTSASSRAQVIKKDLNVSEMWEGSLTWWRLCETIQVFLFFKVSRHLLPCRSFQRTIHTHIQDRHKRKTHKHTNAKRCIDSNI